MITRDRQVRQLMKEFARHGEVGRAAVRAGMDRKTARKYLREGKFPSELKQGRGWRTRPDPFAEHWPKIEGVLTEIPDIDAAVLMDWIVENWPGKYHEGQLRTLQRRLKQWRATSGPPKELFFPQEHRPGEAMQTDFTRGDSLGVTIEGEAFPHLLCHPVLPYSNWEWVTVVRSESLAALRRGVQDAVFELGAVPEWHQTDNSTSATHDLPSKKRGFNEEYLELVKHLGMKPRTTAVGAKEQNGDVESLHRPLKRRAEQLLLLRGSRDFESVQEYESWIRGEVVGRANDGRREKLGEELSVMRALPVRRLPEYSELEVRVSSGATLRVKTNTYSVPSQLRGEKVRVRLFDDRVEVFYGGQRRFVMDRLLGKQKHRIDYRHVIDSLVRKLGAFRRYRYREALFPTLTFRKAYDALCASLPERKADLEYLQVLKLAARTMESDVETALELLLERGALPSLTAVKEVVAPETPEIPAMASMPVDLTGYDGLLGSMLKEVAS